MNLFYKKLAHILFGWEYVEYSYTVNVNDNGKFLYSYVSSSIKKVYKDPNGKNIIFRKGRTIPISDSNEIWEGGQLMWIFKNKPIIPKVRRVKLKVVK
jgi:hypothetical protein